MDTNEKTSAEHEVNLDSLVEWTNNPQTEGYWWWKSDLLADPKTPEICQITMKPCRKVRFCSGGQMTGSVWGSFQKAQICPPNEKNEVQNEM